MPEYRLTHEVIDHNENLLLPAGTWLTGAVMRQLAGQAGASRPMRRLLAYGCIRSDLLEFVEAPPYDVIFAGDDRKRLLLDIAGDVVMPEALLEAIYLFRERDFYTYRHTLLVFALSVLISHELIEDRATLMQEVLAGPVHDIGKLCVPLEILAKETPLTPGERTHLEHHALAGYVLLAHYFGDADMLAARVARDHHERRDGSGYPLGRCLDSSLMDIIMVADVYDALISPRPYRRSSYDNRSALEEMVDQARGGVLSETVVRVLVALNRRDQPDFRSCMLSSEKRGTPPSKNLYGVTRGPDAGDPGSEG